MTLVDAYSSEDAALILWELLKERTPEQAISHEEMPNWEEHSAYVRSRPYPHWYLLDNGTAWVGSIYLTQRREIGIFVFRVHQRQGYGKAAIEELMRLHPGRFYANVAPMNFDSHAFFNRLDFEVIQLTYRFGE